MASKKLYRNPKDGKIAGVCAGLADYFDADVTAIRLLTLAFIVLTAFVPGLVLYFGAAIVMPTKAAKS